MQVMGTLPSLFLTSVLLLVCRQTLAQGCSNACPPSASAGGDLCPGDSVVNSLSGLRAIAVCHPAGKPDLDLSSFYSAQLPPQGLARIVVIANHYIGCNAGRREANVYTYVAKMINSQYPNVIFLSSLKGGSAGQCSQWANIYETSGAVNIPASVEQTAQPLTIDDSSYLLRDTFFTAPYPHPSYVIIGSDGRVRYKFVGPCCGYASYYSCSTSAAMSLNTTISNHVQTLLEEAATTYGGSKDCFLGDWSDWDSCACSQSYVSRTRSRLLLQHAIGKGTCADLTETQACSCATPVHCEMSDWTPWSNCSLSCGNGAERSRTRNVSVQPAFGGNPCPSSLVETEACQLPACQGNQEQCVPLLGEVMEAVVVASAEDGLSSPRDVAFTPKPGFHLGNFSSGQNFPTAGPEAWVANGNGNSITIIASAGLVGQKPLTRYDRGWYHYMMNVTAISFNSVADSGRHPDRDTYGYFATCQDNNNDYDGLKYRNFFMGPTLYNSDPTYKNLVRNDGGECTPADECFFLHSDMLHESPSCAGIVHDPEVTTAYGTVFWAVDGVVEHLVRYDFQQPHGPSLMDHSIAAVRRYPEVVIPKGPQGLRVGMVVDGATRKLFIAVAATGQILEVNIDSGKYARTAREEYPVYSSYLPSFEYSIYGCVEHRVFASGLDMPSGIALQSGVLYVAEYSTGSILVFDVASGFRIKKHAAVTSPGLMGLAIAPNSGGHLFGVNSVRNELLEFRPTQSCAQNTLAPYASTPHTFNATNCTPNSTIPSGALFEQVHVDSGYASSNAAVQDDSMVDESAYFLRFVTDCSNASLNFDALLLGGYHCHVCLPDNCATRGGGACSNIWWNGYTCDNEIRINGTQGNFECNMDIVLTPNRTYRFVVNTPGTILSAASNGTPISDSVEVGTFSVLVKEPFPTAIVGLNGEEVFPIAINLTTSPPTSEAPNKPVVSTIVTLQNIDYDKLMADVALKAAVEQSVIDAFLSQLENYTASHISVTFSNGSVKAKVDITPKTGSDITTLQSRVTTTVASVATDVASRVQAIPNLQMVLQDGKSASDVTATANAPTVAFLTRTTTTTTQEAIHGSTTTTWDFNISSSYSRDSASMVQNVIPSMMLALLLHDV